MNKRAGHEPWQRAVKRSAVRLRARFGEPDRDLAERMVRLFRAGLLPRGKAGRKPEERTAVAAGLFVAGMEEFATRRSGVSLPSLRLYQRTL